MLYLDASVLVSLLTRDALSDQALALMDMHNMPVIVSDFALIEFASAVARQVRMGNLTEQEARMAFMSLDAFIIRTASRIDTTPADLKFAEAALRRLDLPLRTGDALNVAIAGRLGATLATFDRKMAKAAKALGVPVTGESQCIG